MIASDPFSQRYAEFLDNTYDVVDRIVLTAYCGLASSAGGFRFWWRQLYGTDENLDNTHLMRMAGRFARRVRGWGKKHNIPVVYCAAGERKHDLAEHYRPAALDFRGVFAVLISKAPAPVWEVSRSKNGWVHLCRRASMPYVNHYSFHILDDEWGHVTIKICGQPPFRAMVILNGHEYTARRARKAGLTFRKDGNCFTDVSDAPALAKVADSLRSKAAVGRLQRVCERWIYRCVCFGLSFAEQKRSGFRYSYSVFQAEYSRNLLFHHGQPMEHVFQGVIDRTRSRLDVPTVRTIFGARHRPWTRSRSSPRFEHAIERPLYDLTVFKIHFGRLTVKIYTKGERVLRIEAVAHNVEDLRCRKGIERFPLMVGKLMGLLDRFLGVVHGVDVVWISQSALEGLPTPGLVDHTRVAGVDIHKRRIRAVMESVVALSAAPDGFSAAQLAARVRRILVPDALGYTPRHAAYDLKKLRGKDLVRKTHAGSRRYEPTSDGLRAMAAIIVLRDKLILPLLASNARSQQDARSHPLTEIDVLYQEGRETMQRIFDALRIAA